MFSLTSVQDVWAYKEHEAGEGLSLAVWRSAVAAQSAGCIHLVQCVNELHRHDREDMPCPPFLETPLGRPSNDIADRKEIRQIHAQLDRRRWGKEEEEAQEPRVAGSRHDH